MPQPQAREYRYVGRNRMAFIVLSRYANGVVCRSVTSERCGRAANVMCASPVLRVDNVQYEVLNTLNYELFIEHERALSWSGEGGMALRALPSFAITLY